MVQVRDAVNADADAKTKENLDKALEEELVKISKCSLPFSVFVTGFSPVLRRRRSGSASSTDIA